MHTLSTVEVYDPTTDTWTQKAHMPTPRWTVSVSAVNGKIYAIGGLRSSVLPTVEEYDPITNKWTRKANMPTARASLSTVVVDGKIYALGGGTGMSGPVVKTVEVYEPITNTWTTKADMPTPRWFFSISAMNDEIYTIGGSTFYPPHSSVSTVEVYTFPPLVVAEPEVLVQGSQLPSANGIFFDSYDQLYIACGLGPEIVGMDIETGEIVDRITTEVHSPDDLTFGPDGSLYWTDILTGEVGRYAPDGIITKQFVALGVNPITFSDDGRLFTALAFLGDALYELDPDLVDPPRLIAENLGMLNGFDFGPDGFLYSPLPFLGKIVRINVDTGEITPVVTEGIMAPSVKFDSQGHLHAQNYMNGQIVHVDTETGNMEVITSVTFEIDNLAFNSQDRLFISDAGDGIIYEVLDDGTTRAVNSGGLIATGSIAVLPRPDGGESVFAADVWSLREFDAATGEIRGTYTVDCNPTSVSADGENLILSSWLLGNTVQVWNPQTQETLETYTDFSIPTHAIRFQEDLVVAELGMSEGEGRVVRVIPTDPIQYTTLAEGLGVPACFAATDDDLWVSDWAAGTVLQLVVDGEPLVTPIPVATGLAYPEGLAVGPDGNLLVVETKGGRTGRLLRISLESGAVRTVFKGLKLRLKTTPAFPPMHICNGVAVDSLGTIYLTSDIKNQIIAIAPID
jgi:sugar lactone lactonase YvrE